MVYCYPSIFCLDSRISLSCSAEAASAAKTPTIAFAFLPCKEKVKTKVKTKRNEESEWRRKTEAGGPSLVITLPSSRNQPERGDTQFESFGLLWRLLIWPCSPHNDTNINKLESGVTFSAWISLALYQRFLFGGCKVNAKSFQFLLMFLPRDN